MKALIRLTAITAGLVSLLDQAAKFAVREHLAVCYGPPVSACDRVALVGPLGLLRTQNPDSAFGLVDGRWLADLLVLAVALVASQGAIVRARSGETATGILAVSIGLQLGGLLGNLADRVLVGTVTDFIDIRLSAADQGVVLNPADLALAAGALLLTAVVWSATGRSHNGPQPGVARSTSSPSRDDRHRPPVIPEDARPVCTAILRSRRSVASLSRLRRIRGGFLAVFATSRFS